jgi:hypothetical protein
MGAAHTSETWATLPISIRHRDLRAVATSKVTTEAKIGTYVGISCTVDICD